jgi:hypothetical protein
MVDGVVRHNENVAANPGIGRVTLRYIGALSDLAGIGF